MKAPANVVMNMVGRRTRRATPTQKTVKTRAPSTPIMRPARRAKTRTVMVIITKRPRGTPVRANWERRKDLWVLALEEQI